MDALFFGLLVIGGSTAVSVLGLLAVRKFVPVDTLEPLHDVAGNMLAIIGTMYALVLALVVVDAMSNMYDARMNSEMEANGLADVARCASAMPAPHNINIVHACYRYAAVVVRDEWPSLEKGEPAASAWRAFDAIWDSVVAVEPETERAKTMYAQMVQELSGVSDSRRSRIVTSRHGLSQLLWVVLVFGGVVTIASTYFFGLKNLRAQVFMTALVAITLSLNVYLVLAFGYPFKGVLRVKPEGFQLDLSRWEQRLKKLNIEPPTVDPPVTDGAP